MGHEELLRRLRSSIQGARAMPMSSSAVVNRAELLDLVGQLERALSSGEPTPGPAEVHDEAQQIIGAAKQERERLVAEHEVYRVAKQEAERMRREAKAESEGLQQDADVYVDGRLANFEITLNRTLEAVVRGRRRLHSRETLDEESLDALAASDDRPPLPDHG